MNPDGVVSLLAEIVRDLPNLVGAACVDQYRLYDDEPGQGHQYRARQRARVQRAATLCAGCPARTRCTSVTVVAAMEVMPAPRRSAPPPGVLPAA